MLQGQKPTAVQWGTHLPTQLEAQGKQPMVFTCRLRSTLSLLRCFLGELLSNPKHGCCWSALPTEDG